MKKRNLVWIPFFGMYLTKLNPFIITHNNWIVYQMMSTIVAGAYALIMVYRISAFLMFLAK